MQPSKRGGRGRGRVGRKKRKRIKWVLVVVAAAVVRPMSAYALGQWPSMGSD